MNAINLLSSILFSEEGANASPSVLQLLKDNFWYIVLVVAFGAGLILVSVWSKKIKKNDEKLKEEMDRQIAEAEEEAVEETEAAEETVEEAAEEVKEAAEAVEEAAEAVEETAEEVDPSVGIGLPPEKPEN